MTADIFIFWRKVCQLLNFGSIISLQKKKEKIVGNQANFAYDPLQLYLVALFYEGELKCSP